MCIESVEVCYINTERSCARALHPHMTHTKGRWRACSLQGPSWGQVRLWMCRLYHHFTRSLPGSTEANKLGHGPEFHTKESELDGSVDNTKTSSFLFFLFYCFWFLISLSLSSCPSPSPGLVLFTSFESAHIRTQ